MKVWKKKKKNFLKMAYIQDSTQTFTISLIGLLEGLGIIIDIKVINHTSGINYLWTLESGVWDASPEAIEGDSIEVSPSVINNGDVTDTLFVQFSSLQVTPLETAIQVKIDCLVGDYLIPCWTFTMPAKNVNITINAGHISFSNDYKDYLNNNPKVKSLINAYDSTIKAYLLDYVDELEKTGSIFISEPSCLESNPSDSSTCYMDDSTTKKVLAAKSAYAIWLDKNNKVPWKLEDYSIDELKNIIRDEIECSQCAQDYFRHIVDYSPSLTYQYTKDAIKDSKEATLYALVDKMRTFRHGLEGEPNGYVAIDTAFQEKISRVGCWSMSKLITALSRNLNIPGYVDSGWFGGGHASVLFPEISILIHGDDVYNSYLKETSSNELLASWSYFKTKIEPIGKAGYGELNYWAMRYNALNMVNYVSDSLKFECCFFHICEDEIRKIASPLGYSFHTGETSCLSESEINNAINNIMATC